MYILSTYQYREMGSNMYHILCTCSIVICNEGHYLLMVFVFLFRLLFVYLLFFLFLCLYVYLLVYWSVYKLVGVIVSYWTSIILCTVLLSL